MSIFADLNSFIVKECILGRIARQVYTLFGLRLKTKRVLTLLRKRYDRLSDCEIDTLRRDRSHCHLVVGSAQASSATEP